ncbi:CHAT domain-containing protein [Sediminicola luteus]|uniref:CHAT domain-containing protein n=1 Tax=Sediminicola luteus TaxID=319238 RepID=A0A2A4G3H2_9FLAO|nr:CHAT domain-containing protein [Sediminicola luteus]PCE62981.1 hypothetical protein B7P33_17040 [Sediminicola luteus]
MPISTYPHFPRPIGARKPKWRFLYPFLATLLAIHGTYAQHRGNDRIDSLLRAKRYHQAIDEIDLQWERDLQLGRMDSLERYVDYLAMAHLRSSGPATAKREIDTFIGQIPDLGLQDRKALKLYDRAIAFYDRQGFLERSRLLTLRTLELIKNIQGATQEEIGKTTYNLGVCHLSLGQVSKADSIFVRALEHYKKDGATQARNLSDLYNALGATAWMSTELDKAKNHYGQALEILINKDSTGNENLLQSASIRANIALLEQSMGGLESALRLQRQVINDYDKIIRTTEDTELRANAKRNRLFAIYNLSIYHNDLGQVDKARDIIRFAHGLAEGLLSPHDPELPRYAIALAQSELALRNWSQAKEFALRGLSGLDSIGLTDPLWQGNAHYVLAKIASENHDIPGAKDHFDRAEKLYIRSDGEGMGKEHLGLLRDKALFLARHGYQTEAVGVAEKPYSYIKSHNMGNGQELLKSVGNLAEVQTKLGNHQMAIHWADTGISLSTPSPTSATGLDRIQKDLYRSQFILIKVRSSYYMEKSPNVAFLTEQLEVLKEVVGILEKRKEITTNNGDLDQLYERFKELGQLRLRLMIDLYERTKDPGMITKILAVHESTVYNRIRLKFNLAGNRFKNVPIGVVKREQALIKRVNNILRVPNGNMEDYFTLMETWKRFKDSLKNTLPSYYNLRYANLTNTLKDVPSRIPQRTTLIRYLRVEGNYFVYVASKKGEVLIDLGKVEIAPYLSDIQRLGKIERSSRAAQILYDRLWKPFETHVSTERVIIYPDGELFNLSFELLCPEKVTTFGGYAHRSLLAKHDFSYHYSLMLLDPDQSPTLFPSGLVAYAPEFNNRMKTEYKMALKDTLDFDEAYLTLLPQPFSYRLAQKLGKEFDGTMYLNERASKKLFSQRAKEHKIIHIGTHAESNNLRPELSRLVFAKNITDSLDLEDNNLYTYEIYNQNLSSNLAILTACETGKPGYRPGEGMISLAHAFHYAGSESILTSQWQIDERSSARILESFYNRLKEGLTKDRALRMAKLEYLRTAQGRELHPQYWAGLILMGDTAPIDFYQSKTTIWPWVVIIFVAILVLLFIGKWNSIDD